MAGNTDDGAAINVIEQTENELLDEFSKMKVVDLKKFLKIAYLISKCDWTPKNVQKYRESRGYQLAEQGRIHGVKLHVLSNFVPCKLLYVKALCTRPTSQGEALNQVWGIVMEEGVIHTGFNNNYSILIYCLMSPILNK